MSVVFDYLQRRLAEFGSSYWKNNSFDIRLVNKTTTDIDHSALDYTLSNLVEVSGTNYLPKKSSNNTVSQFDNGKVVYTFDDVVWESSSVSSDGVLVTNGQFPLIFIDFGYRRLSENGNFGIQWGDDGLIYLETGNEAVSSTSTDTSASSSGIESGNNLGGGNGLYAGVTNKTINFKSIVSDKWIVISSTGEEVKFSLNRDFIVAGDNIKIEKNVDGSVTINANVTDNKPVLSNEVEYKLDKHIGDTVIHVTQADKDNWNSPTSWNDLEDKPTTISELGITNVYTKTEVDNLIGDTEVSWSEINDKPNTVSGFGITDVYTKTQVDNLIGDPEVSWDEINDKPNTVSGYGITDVYTKTEIDAHTNDTVIHVTQTDRNRWDGVESDYVYYVGSIGDTTIIVTHNLDTLDYVVEYVDMSTNSSIVLVAEQNLNTVVIDDLNPLVMNQQLKVVIRKLNKKN